jgi:hypothetical protein
MWNSIDVYTRKIEREGGEKEEIKWRGGATTRRVGKGGTER